jgi:hypothetical protein
VLFRSTEHGGQSGGDTISQLPMPVMSS